MSLTIPATPFPVAPIALSVTASEQKQPSEGGYHVPMMVNTTTTKKIFYFYVGHFGEKGVTNPQSIRISHSSLLFSNYELPDVTVALRL